MQVLNNPVRLATATAEGQVWTLKRNCSVTPAQLAICFGFLSMVSLTVGLFFWFHGALLVLPFAALELLVLAAAFLIHARHAADRECISVRDGELVVEVERAGRIERSAFVRDWVRIEPDRRHGLLEVKGGGRSVRIGRFLRADLHPLLARELRQAVRDAGAVSAGVRLG